MKIAQVIYNLECGGAEKMVAQLSSELAQLGHSIEVVRLDNPTHSVHERVATCMLSRYGVPWSNLNRALGSPGLLAAFKLWALVQRRQYDVVHSHLPLSDAIVGFVRRLSPTRFHHVLTVHSTRESRTRSFTFLADGSTAAYCSDAALARTVLHPKASVVIPNGISEACPVSTTGKKDVRRRLGIGDGAVVVIAVGNMRKSKNYVCGLEGLALLQQALPHMELHFIICGDGPERLPIHDEASNSALKNRVHLLGNITEVGDMLSAADIFLSTSLHEGMPLAVLEAFSSGLPCVLSPIEEHREIARNMDGTILLRDNTPPGVAEALRSFIDRPASLRSYAAARKQHLEPFTMKRCAAAYSNLYRRLSRNDATGIGEVHLEAYE